MWTVEEVAVKLKISPRRVRALIGAERIKAKKFAKVWLITDYSNALNRKAGNPHHKKSKLS